LSENSIRQDRTSGRSQKLVKNLRNGSAGTSVFPQRRADHRIESRWAGHLSKATPHVKSSADVHGRHRKMPTTNKLLCLAIFIDRFSKKISRFMQSRISPIMIDVATLDRKNKLF
jgi:hypothetical protein